jgi:hypothetical protein
MKQPWVHYPNLLYYQNSLLDFLQGLTSMTTNLNQQSPPLELMDNTLMQY